MRIVHVIPTYLPAVRYGGPIFATHALCKALVGNGHEVRVFTTNIDGPGASPVPLKVPTEVEGITVRYFPSPAVRRLYWTPELRRVLETEIGKFDVLHLHSVFLWPTWAAARLARKVGIPYVLSPRGMLVRDLIRRRSWLAKSLWLEIIDKSNIEKASAVHLTSQLEARELQRLKLRLPRLSIIPNGVEEPESRGGAISEDIQRIVAEQPLVLYLGRLSWKKGLDRLLTAFASTTDGKLAIAGTDDEGLAPRLANLARDLHIGNRVHILPRSIIGSEKEQLFGAARLFVLTSYSENFGNTVLEAMRRGVPVVVTPEVGAADIVRESGGGLIVAGEPSAIGVAICQLISDLDLSRTMGAAGQRHAVAHHSWKHIATRMALLYESVIRANANTKIIDDLKC